MPLLARHTHSRHLHVTHLHASHADNYDDPRLTDYETLMANLTDLKEGRPTRVPIYDFKVHI